MFVSKSREAFMTFIEDLQIIKLYGDDLTTIHEALIVTSPMVIDTPFTSRKTTASLLSINYTRLQLFFERRCSRTHKSKDITFGTASESNNVITIVQKTSNSPSLSVLHLSISSLSAANIWPFWMSQTLWFIAVIILKIVPPRKIFFAVVWAILTLTQKSCPILIPALVCTVPVTTSYCSTRFASVLALDALFDIFFFLCFLFRLSKGLCGG